MTNKKTNRDFFNEVIALANGNEELTAWATEQIEKLDTRKANRKPTKTQTENVALKATIHEVLTAIGKPATVTEILKAGDFGVISNQKVSALLKQMVEVDKTVTKEVDKKKSYFTAVTNAE